MDGLDDGCQCKQLSVFDFGPSHVASHCVLFCSHLKVGQLRLESSPEGIIQCTVHCIAVFVGKAAC